MNIRVASLESLHQMLDIFLAFVLAHSGYIRSSHEVYPIPCQSPARCRKQLNVLPFDCEPNAAIVRRKRLVIESALLSMQERFQFIAQSDLFEGATVVSCESSLRVPASSGGVHCVRGVGIRCVTTVGIHFVEVCVRVY